MVISFQMFEIYKILVAEFGLIGRGIARVGQVPDERDRKKERNRKKKIKVLESMRVFIIIIVEGTVSMSSTLLTNFKVHNTAL